jgi:hypothetical protein
MDEQAIYLILECDNINRSFYIRLSDSMSRIIDSETQQIFFAVGVSLLAKVNKEPPNMRIKILIGEVDCPINLIEIFK